MHFHNSSYFGHIRPSSGNTSIRSVMHCALIKYHSFSYVIDAFFILSRVWNPEGLLPLKPRTARCIGSNNRGIVILTGVSTVKTEDSMRSNGRRYKKVMHSKRQSEIAAKGQSLEKAAAESSLVLAEI
jgi:hypothetical protein